MIKHACSSDKCKAHSFLSILSKISPFSVKEKKDEGKILPILCVA